MHGGVRVALEEFDDGDKAGILGKILCPWILLQLGENVRGANHVGPFRANHALGSARYVRRIISKALISLNICI